MMLESNAMMVAVKIEPARLGCCGVSAPKSLASLMTLGIEIPVIAVCISGLHTISTAIRQTNMSIS